MKNVAKCDTWCELQNPVNHRVFERKLCLMPFGGGHICLCVTFRVCSSPFVPRSIAMLEVLDAKFGSSCPSARWAEDWVAGMEEYS